MATAKTAAGLGEKKGSEGLVCIFSNQRFYPTNTEYIEISLGGKTTIPALKSELSILLSRMDKKIVNLLRQDQNFKHLRQGDIFNLKNFLQTAQTDGLISAVSVQECLDSMSERFTKAVVCPILSNPDSNLMPKSALKETLRGYGIDLQHVIQYIKSLVEAKLKRATQVLKAWLAKINQAWELELSLPL